MIKMITCTDKNGGIGKEGKLPWPKFSEDMLHFKKATDGQVIIMGKKTFESLNGFLPNRYHIILTRNTYNVPKAVENFLLTDSIEKALTFCSGNGWIIGGEEIYRLAMPYTNQIIMTKIEKEYDCDKFFPEISSSFNLKQEVERFSDSLGVKFKFMNFVR